MPKPRRIKAFCFFFSKKKTFLMGSRAGAPTRRMTYHADVIYTQRTVEYGYELLRIVIAAPFVALSRIVRILRLLCLN
jgi:hypothetical protein